MKRVVLAALIIGAACVSGSDLVSPGEPDYAALCVDSTMADTVRICSTEGATITVTIPNPIG